MSLLWLTLAAMAGGVVGAAIHEGTHLATAAALGVVEAVGWQGGLAGGPYVDYRVQSRWRSEAVRKSPLLLGLAALGGFLVSFDGVGLVAMFEAGVISGLLWASPEDLFADAAQREASAT